MQNKSLFSTAEAWRHAKTWHKVYVAFCALWTVLFFVSLRAVDEPATGQAAPTEQASPDSVDDASAVASDAAAAAATARSELLGQLTPDERNYALFAEAVTGDPGARPVFASDDIDSTSPVCGGDTLMVFGGYGRGDSTPANRVVIWPLGAKENGKDVAAESRFTFDGSSLGFYDSHKFIIDTNERLSKFGDERVTFERTGKTFKIAGGEYRLCTPPKVSENSKS